MDAEQLLDLSARLDAATGPNKSIDRRLARLAGYHRIEPRHIRSKHGGWIAPEDWAGTMSDGSPILDGLHGTTIYRDVPAYTARLDAAIDLVESVLPGWSWRVASCSVSDDAWAQPDFNNPTLAGSFTEEERRDWFEAHPECDVDQRPPGRPALALCRAIVSALIVRGTR